jgi:hypothetical protein
MGEIDALRRGARERKAKRLLEVFIKRHLSIIDLRKHGIL